MPPAVYSASPTPGPSARAKNLVGDALYAWCCKEHEYGHVFMQDELLDSNVVPNRDLGVLVVAAQYLVDKHLFKLHDVKGHEGVGWELIEPNVAQSYEGLTTDEQMVYSLIEGVGTMGIWTKTIKARLSAHARVLDQVYKSLERRQLIKQMKSVKNPGRKMYILFGLQPSEEATGGAWFTEGRLDIEMIDAISGFVEQFCSRRSWREVVQSDDEDEESSMSRKRRQPDAGFDTIGKGKGKAVKRNDERPEHGDDQTGKTSKPKAKQSRYEPHEAGYTGYPTTRDVSKEILQSNVLESGQALPEPALAQLMDVMVFDGRLYKIRRPARSGEVPDDQTVGLVTTYRCFKNPHELRKMQVLVQKIQNGSRTARRQQELEDIGQGGSGEVPCWDCPNFDICGDGGPVNAETCVYFDDWYRQMEDADREVGIVWESNKKIIRPKIENSRR